MYTFHMAHIDDFELNFFSYSDEILYHARLHPECYTNNLEESHVADLHKALLEVTKIAVEMDADSSKFPDNWLMLHRWGKGKKAKEENKLPSGEQVEFVTVGGRTSAYVPVLQKKVGPSAEERKPPKKTKRKNVKEDEEDGSAEEMVETAKAPKKRQVKKETKEMTSVPEEDRAAKAPRKRRVKKEIEEQSSVLEVTKGAKASKKRQGKKEVGQPSSALKDAIAEIPAVQDEKSANGIESEAIRERKIEHKEHKGPVKVAKPEKDGDTRTSDFTGLRRSSRRK
jgi:formamidopyrimidine-DNA glycosylase